MTSLLIKIVEIITENKKPLRPCLLLLILSNILLWICYANLDQLISSAAFQRMSLHILVSESILLLIFGIRLAKRPKSIVSCPSCGSFQFFATDYKLPSEGNAKKRGDIVRTRKCKICGYEERKYEPP